MAIKEVTKMKKEVENIEANFGKTTIMFIYFFLPVVIAHIIYGLFAGLVSSLVMKVTGANDLSEVNAMVLSVVFYVFSFVIVFVFYRFSIVFNYPDFEVIIAKKEVTKKKE